MRVNVFGLGYVGCVTAACLAKAGHQVLGVDINAEKVAMVNAAAPPVVEPGLGELLTEVVRAGRLRATTSSDEAVAASEIDDAHSRRAAHEREQIVERLLPLALELVVLPRVPRINRHRAVTTG